jgi:hypothetical protein
MTPSHVISFPWEFPPPLPVSSTTYDSSARRLSCRLSRVLSHADPIAICHIRPRKAPSTGSCGTRTMYTRSVILALRAFSRIPISSTTAKAAPKGRPSTMESYYTDRRVPHTRTIQNTRNDAARASILFRKSSTHAYASLRKTPLFI